MNVAGDRLSVKTICKLTGINEHTLRAWERRYQVVEPERLENGRRVYSLDDLEKLKLVGKLLKNGFLIGHIASQNHDELVQLLQDTGYKSTSSAASPDLKNLEKSIQSLLVQFDLRQVNTLLEKAKIEYGVRAFTFEFVLPYVSKIPTLLLEGTLSTCHERILSAMLRQQLLQILFSLDLLRRKDAVQTRTFVVACMADNFNEIPMLIAAIACTLNGFSAIYMGSDVPCQALTDTMKASSSNTLIVGLPLVGGYKDRIESYVNELNEAVVHRARLWFYGSGEYSFVGQTQENAKYLDSLRDLDQLLLSFS